jgi:hypothetical protein
VIPFGKRGGQFFTVLQLKEVACLPELIYVGLMQKINIHDMPVFGSWLVSDSPD